MKGTHLGRLVVLVLMTIAVIGCSSGTAGDSGGDSGGSGGGSGGVDNSTGVNTCAGSGCSTTDTALLLIDDLTYLGAFRISSDAFGDSTVDYAIGTLAYNPDNSSLFVAGHNYHTAVGEFAIPELLDRDNVSELNVVETALQDFRSVLGTTEDVDASEAIASPVSNPQNVNRITGLLYVDGQLIVNAEEWYDAGADNTDTTVVIRDAANLSSSEVDGFYELGGAATAAGYLSEIPAEWQAGLGGNYLTGWASNYSIISRYSVGPSLFVFNEADLLDTSETDGSVSTTAFMNFVYSGGNYLSADALLQDVPGSASALWNFLSRGMYGFIVPGTRTFAVFGSSSGIESGIGYKITQDDGYECGGYCSYAADDIYNYYWFFDVQEILDAANVYDIEPYAYGLFSVPFDNQGHNRIIGGTFDSTNSILYLSLENAGQMYEDDRPPLIVGYQVPSS